MIERCLLRAGLTIVALAICAYGVALTGDYVFDDVHSVSGNPAVQDLANFGQFWTLVRSAARLRACIVPRC